MSYRIVDDSELAKRNQSLIICGGSSAAYNAVISVSFADEAEYTTQLTLQRIKDFCSIDGTDLDAMLEADIIPGARIICEERYNRSFVARKVTAKVRNDLGNQELPYGPVRSVTIEDVTTTIISITDDEGESVTIADYDFGKPEVTGELIFVYNAGYDDNELPAKYRLAWLNEIHYQLDGRRAKNVS